MFRLLIPVTFVFVLTCLVMLTFDLFGSPRTPLARVLTKYGTVVLAVEAAMAVLLAVIAMASDRWTTLRHGANAAECAVDEPGAESLPDAGDADES